MARSSWHGCRGRAPGLTTRSMSGVVVASPAMLMLHIGASLGCVSLRLTEFPPRSRGSSEWQDRRVDLSQRAAGAGHARPHSSATGLISLDRSRSWIPPHRLFVNSLVLSPSSSSWVSRQRAAKLSSPPTPRSPALGRAAKPAAPRPGLAEQNRRYRTRLASSVPTSLMSVRAHRDVHRRAEAVVLDRA